MTNEEKVQEFILEHDYLRDADDLNVYLTKDKTTWALDLENLLNNFANFINPKTQAIELAVESEDRTINVPDPFYVFMKFDEDTPLGVVTSTGDEVNFTLNRPTFVENSSISIKSNYPAISFMKGDKSFSMYSKLEAELTDEEKSLINLK